MAQAARAAPIVNQIMVFNDTAEIEIDSSEAAGDLEASLGLDASVASQTADPWQGTPIQFPDYEVPSGCCILYEEEYYEGLQQSVCNTSDPITLAQVRSVACADNAVAMAGGIQSMYNQYFFYRNAVPKLVFPEDATSFFALESTQDADMVFGYHWSKGCEGAVVTSDMKEDDTTPGTWRQKDSDKDNFYLISSVY